MVDLLLAVSAAKVLRTLFITRYLSAVALALILYDHAITFANEIDLVWTAPGSLVKWAFLMNRYIVPFAQLLNATYLGFNVKYSDIGCRQALTATTALGICSMATANFLVLLRVVRNWDRDRSIILWLSSAFMICSTAQCIFLIKTVVSLQSHTFYDSVFRTCIVVNFSPFLVAVWAIPLVFEFLVLSCSLWNAVDRPRDARIPFSSVLLHDGVAFFAMFASLRSINLILAVVGHGGQAYLGTLIVWTAITVVLNRAIFFFRQKDDLQVILQSTEYKETWSAYF
jgi:hypothetical protein